MNHVKRIVKKAVSLLLVLVMIESMTPVTAQAAIRCRHDGAKHWVYLNGSDKHVQICDSCGARLKTEMHDLFKDSDWNFQYDAYGHHQICKKCGFTNELPHSYTRTTARIHDATHGNVLVCVEPKCKHIAGGNESKAYCIYDCQYVNTKYHKTSCVYCDYTIGNKKCTPKDYVEHDWQFLSNKSSHWYECKECHAVMDNSGHHYRQSDWEEYGQAVKMTSCDVCGWCKSCKISTKQNDKGNWIEWKETVENIPSSDLPVPGPSDNIVQCDHKDCTKSLARWLPQRSVSFFL